jgi:hypothetical protein
MYSRLNHPASVTTATGATGASPALQQMAGEFAERQACNRHEKEDRLLLPFDGVRPEVLKTEAMNGEDGERAGEREQRKVEV